ncbi:MAG: DUF1707 domain-containing protein [Streptosporangiaceae bacterium]
MKTSVMAGSNPSDFADCAGWEVPVAMEPQDPTAGWAAFGGHLRASDADRERVIDFLKAAFVQRRLSQSDLTGRVGQVLESKTYAELAGATSGIPARRADTPRPRQPVVPVRPRQPAAPVRASPVSWKVIAWVVGVIVVSPGLAVAFFDTYYGSFFILLFAGFIASGLVGSPGTPRPDRHSMF